MTEGELRYMRAMEGALRRILHCPDCLGTGTVYKARRLTVLGNAVTYEDDPMCVFVAEECLCRSSARDLVS